MTPTYLKWLGGLSDFLGFLSGIYFLVAGYKQEWLKALVDKLRLPPTVASNSLLDKDKRDGVESIKQELEYDPSALRYMRIGAMLLIASYFIHFFVALVSP